MRELKNDELKFNIIDMPHTQTHEQVINMLKGVYGIMDSKQLIKQIMLNAKELKESQQQ